MILFLIFIHRIKNDSKNSRKNLYQKIRKKFLIFIFKLLNCKLHNKTGIVAQRLEQDAHNVLVVGSIPTDPTNYILLHYNNL
jgi:hypothetical protein